MTDPGARDTPVQSSRHERRVQRLRERADGRQAAEGAPRVRAAHFIFFHAQGERMFGPGVYELLVLVEETGSLLQAARTMRMSYSKAWRVTRRAEQYLGIELLSRQAGGPSGGGSVLTEEGRDLVRRFRAFVDEADDQLDELYLKHFGDAPFARPSPGPVRGPDTGT